MQRETNLRETGRRRLGGPQRKSYGQPRAGKQHDAQRELMAERAARGKLERCFSCATLAFCSEATTRKRRAGLSAQAIRRQVCTKA